MRTDTERLDALEELARNGDCPGLVNDDNGFWAMSGEGVQKVIAGDEPQDVATTFFIRADRWRKSIRDAIDVYLDAREAE